MENKIENGVTGENNFGDINSLRLYYSEAVNKLRLYYGEAVQAKPVDVVIADEPVLKPKVRATPLNLKCCYWCRGWKSAGVLPLRRDMGSFDNPSVVSGGICWKTQKGVFRFLCNLCNVTEIKLQLERYRRTLL
jgi:hypothetical protein